MEARIGTVSQINNYIKKILDNLEKAVSPEYFSKNVLALINEKGNFDSVPPEITEIIEKWESNPDINLYSEVINHNVKLHYPMLVLYDATASTFDDVIKTVKEKWKEAR